MKKRLGILGGMGPLATADLMQKIVRATRADGDNEHIHIYMDCNTEIPDRSQAILDGGRDPFHEMARSLSTLERCGADCIVIPCNTAHYYLPRLQDMTDIPILNMIDIAARAGARLYPNRTAALICTRGTYRVGIYDEPLRDAQISYITPDERERDVIMTAIYSEKAGRDAAHMREPLQQVLQSLRERGAHYFILACTEMPIIAERLALRGPFIDTSLELARAAVTACGYQLIEE